MDTRNVIFISHATPDDNEFTRWLGLQLAQEGYSIWSDVTKLLGGESFWSDIETAIRDHTIKFIFVLTKASNVRQGALDELHLARTIAKTHSFHDFIIPARLDDLPFDEINIALHRANAIDFSKSWAEGLVQLMEKLETEKIPKSPETFNRGAVATWWRNNFDGLQMLKEEEEVLCSNWFQFTSYPETVYIHEAGQGAYVGNAMYPYYSIGKSIVSFATSEDLQISECIGTHEISMEAIIGWEDNSSGISTNELRNAITFIMKDGIYKTVSATGLGTHLMANDRKCFYFLPENLSAKFVNFAVDNVIHGKRSLVGKVKNRTWHFALSFDVQFDPMLIIVARTHVLFSEDGKTLLYSDKMMASLRRSACKNWWNQHWRDRILAGIAWIADKLDSKPCIRFELGGNTGAAVTCNPVIFTSPIAYDDNFFIHDAVLEESDSDIIDDVDAQE